MAESPKIMLRVPQEDADALRAVAAWNGSTPSDEMRRALLAHLDRETARIAAEKDDARRAGRAIVSDKAVPEPSLGRA